MQVFPSSARSFAALALGMLVVVAPSWAQAQRLAQGQTSVPLGSLGENSKDPIKIDADRLDVFDKESRAVFAGNVVAVQGKTTIRCSKMTIHYNSRGQTLPGQGQGDRPAAAGAGSDGGIKRLDCDGPVTVTSEDQVATGDKAIFDREKEIVVLTGKVALVKGQNITRGERMTYNTKTGVANIEGGRVQGFFVPGADDGNAASRPAPRRAPAGPNPTN